MVGKYHDDIKDSVFQIFNENRGKFRRVFGSNRKMEITHPTIQKKSISYYPDAILISKNGKYYIFQVLDSQDKIKAYTIANVVEAYLSEQVSKVFFVVKSDESAQKAQEIVEVVLANIEDISKSNYRPRPTFFYPIISDKIKKENVKKKLEEAILEIPKEVEEEIRKIESSKLSSFVLGKSKLR